MSIESLALHGLAVGGMNLDKEPQLSRTVESKRLVSTLSKYLIPHVGESNLLLLLDVCGVAPQLEMYRSVLRGEREITTTLVVPGRFLDTESSGGPIWTVRIKTDDKIEVASRDGPADEATALTVMNMLNNVIEREYNEAHLQEHLNEAQ